MQMHADVKPPGSIFGDSSVSLRQPLSQPPAVQHLLSPEELAARGKALRDKVPRADHARWKAGKDRRDPIKLLHASDHGRLRELVPIRYGRMLQSPFAFYRGSASVMAADLARTPKTGIRVQACGDCHLMNFGGFATPERNIVFDINDFDETLPGPWEWDVKRLATSFVLAARSIGLSDAMGREAAVACARSYRQRLFEYAEMHPLQVWYARISADDFIESLPKTLQARVRKTVKKAAKGSDSTLDYPKLTHVKGGKVGISDSPPLIFHPEVTRGPEFEAIVEQMFAAYRETLADDRRLVFDQYYFIDAAIKVVGVGSVGRRCWIALLMSASNDPLFLQFKEAVESVLEPYAGKSAYPHHGQRVVVGQRMSQPASDLFLGWVTAPNGRQFYVRHLRDAKIKPMVETWDAEMLTSYATACGWVLARAHAKTGDQAEIAGYLGSSEAFDEAVGDFGLAYADQAERDYGALKAAVRKGKVVAYRET
jgi:uncharacterized protein (DUF2252 family)